MWMKSLQKKYICYKSFVSLKINKNNISSGTKIPIHFFNNIGKKSI